MCDPVTLAMTGMGLGAAQAGVGFLGANAAYKSQMAAYQQNADDVAVKTARNFASIQIKSRQESEAASNQMQKIEVEKARAAASAEMAAAAGGVGGLAAEAALRDIYAQAGNSTSTVQTNLANARSAAQTELVNAHDAGRNAINAMPLPEAPSFLPYALQGFSTGLSAYNTKLQMENS